MKIDPHWLPILLAAGGLAAQAGPITYRVTDLGTLGSSASANAINASGQTAGTLTSIYGDLRAYGPAGDITPAGASDSMASGINSFGQITGTSYVQGTPYATVWVNGSASYLTAGSYGMALNDAGQVTGMSADGHAFVGTTGAMMDLGTLAGGDWTSGYAINGAGQVAGYGDTASGAFRAFVWTGNSLAQLGTLGGMNSYAFAINGAGRVAGSAQTASGYLHAYMTGVGGGLLDLGTLGGGSSYGYGINSSSSVVGYSYTGGGESHAFLYQNGGMIDLNSILTGSAGWLLTAAYGINDSGQIAGSGMLNGVEHAFRLDPVTAASASPQVMIAPLTSTSAVPEPGTIGLMVVGAAMLAVARRRRLT